MRSEALIGESTGPKKPTRFDGGGDELVELLLARRGITDPAERTRFLMPDYEEHLHDPFLLKDMERAVERILRALQGGEKIVCYTDYDTDGTPAGVLLHDFFKKIGYINFINYIPHRHDEGYGLNTGAIDALSKDGATLLITADCGIADIDEVAYAGKKGIDVIVTDHHIPRAPEEGGLPPAYAIINPKRADDAYPFDMLCGAAVAFKLVQALIREGKRQGRFSVPDGWEKWLLDMAGIATVCDMVPLVGENRVLAYYGLKVLQKSRRPGLRALFRATKLRQESITEDDIGFVIGPRINVASRMDTPQKAFELLASTDSAHAGAVFFELNKLNERRKGLVAALIKDARRRIFENETGEVIVLGDPRWHPGILGLAANTLMNELGKPVFLWGGGGGQTLKGSCRSDGTVHVVRLMSASRGVLASYGGHECSGGFSVERTKVHLLERALEEALSSVEKKEPANDKEGIIDAALSLDDVAEWTYRAIERLAPFGIGNPKPLFSFEDVFVHDALMFGRQKNHIKLILEKSDGTNVPAISFFYKDAVAEPTESFKEKYVNLKAHIERNTFMGANEIRLRIAEITPAF